MIAVVKLFEIHEGNFGVTSMVALVLFLLICALAAGKS